MKEDPLDHRNGFTKIKRMRNKFIAYLNLPEYFTVEFNFKIFVFNSTYKI
jgi:hypothetical protein